MPYELEARSGSPNAWAVPHHPGMPEFGEFLLPDGRDARDLIADGDTADLGFTPTFLKEHGNRFGDLLWTTSRSKVASDRFITALAGFAGWKSFPVRLTQRRGEDIPGYAGFAVLPGSADVFLTTNFQHESFGVSDAVMAALREAGVDGFKARRIAG